MKPLKQFKIVTLLCVLLSFSVKGIAFEYSVESIPDSLKEGAVSVVRNYSAVFTQDDINNGTFRVTHVITVLNEKGNSHATFFARKDKFQDLQKFSGIVRSNSGKEIKKIKRGDLIESSFSTEMATDDRKIIYEVSSPVYPYTIEYEYEIKYKNGILGYPPFVPVERSSQSVEKADYRIEIPKGTKLRYHSNFECQKSEEATEKHQVYTVSAKGMEAVKYEPLAPSSDEYIPIVRFGVTDFCYDKVCGNLSLWQNYGIWQKQLLEGRDILPADVVSKIKDLTKDAPTARDKVAILYKHMQDNSRYVSIQLGIGGLQPFPADVTYKSRFGDCKALSNLMMAMLKAIDIPSNYTVIRMYGRKTFLRDFPEVSQANHVILRVPLPNDTIWLECTSQTLPMGYIHDGIAGHDALVITDKGGELCQLPSYTADQNLSESTIVMNIDENGIVQGEMKFTEHVHGFGDHYEMMRSNDRDRHVRYITSKVKMQGLKVGKIKTSEELSDLPSCTLAMDYEAYNFVNKSGKRMFIPLLPLKKSFFSILTSNNRELDIEIDDGFSQSDSIVINIPEGYVVESMPKPTLLLTPYGTLISKAEKKDVNTIVYSQHISVFAGRYDKSKYEEIKNFYKGVAGSTKAKIVVRKEEV